MSFADNFKRCDLDDKTIAILDIQTEMIERASVSDSIAAEVVLATHSAIGL
jgi:hypothetical protein